jgi:hypothetical protein
MTITRFSFLFLLIFAMSCSNDDEVKKSEGKFSFSSEEPIFNVPSKMQNSDNEHALMASSYIQMANGMTSYVGYFNPPQGAKKSSQPIVAENARIASIQTTYEVYEWEYGKTTIAYQWSEQAGFYVFEVFFKEAGSGYRKYLVAKEKKDRSVGSLDYYDISTTNSNPILQWKWVRAGDVITLEYFADSFKLVIVSNTKTNAGEVTYFANGKLFYEYQWDKAGNGSYTFYDLEGNVIDEGEWTV